ncbi:MAG TPA: radical SAM protein [Byssovorax sp.]
MDVTFVLTHDCNLGCGYCYAGRKFARAMSSEVAARALDLAFAGSPSRVALSYFGGEPLLAWPRLVELARAGRARAYADGVHLAQTVTTNGTLLDDARVAALADLDVYVALSIDGTRAAHDVNRPTMGGGSSYDAVSRALDRLTAARRAFEVIAVVTPASVGELGASVAELFARGAPRVVLNPAYEEPWSDADLAEFERGLAAAARSVARCYRDGRVVSLSVFDDKIRARIAGGRGALDKCPVGDGSVAVAPSGNLYACERLVGEDEDHRFIVGHVDHGVDPARIAALRSPEEDKHATNVECGTCVERPRCGAACACANLAETGSPHVAGGVQCWYEQASARVADELAAAMFAERDDTFRRWFFPSGWPAASPPAARAASRVERAPAQRRLPIVG